jgi:hypothetical protein
MSHKIIIPSTHPHHQSLTDMINSFAVNHDFKRVFLSYSNTSQKHFLIIHIKDTHVPEEVQKSKWIKKALQQFHTHIFIMGEQNVGVHLRWGSLFINRHCNASTLIYKKQDHELTYPKLSEHLKKFKQFKEDYYHTQLLLDSEIQRAKENDALSMAYHLYISLFEHHIHYLEILCIGDYFSKGSISERLMRLESFLPDIKTLMLKKTETTYFIIEALHSAKEVDEQQYEFADAIAETEQRLRNLVERTFQQMKKEVKKPEQKPILIENKEVSPYEPVIDVLTKRFRIEEIFLFHQQEVYSNEKKTTVLYILLISKISKDNLFNMMEMVSKQTEGRFNVVPIAHSKAWIQDRLSEQQPFFQKVMVPEKAIYAPDFPSVIHWRTEPCSADTDEGIYYGRCSVLYEKYKLLRSQEEPLAAEGLGLILSGVFYRACPIFIYATLRYRPNDINIRILWKLCEYADPKVKNLDYLIQKLPFDFFEFINPNKNLYRNSQFLDEDTLSILDELAQGFLDILDGHLEWSFCSNIGLKIQVIKDYSKAKSYSFDSFSLVTNLHPSFNFSSAFFPT